MPDLACDASEWSAAYVQLCTRLTLMGVPVAPRGQPTRELPDYTFLIANVGDHTLLPLGTGRKLNLKLGAVEALQLCLGLELPDLAAGVSPQLGEFREDDGRFWGSYGARAGDQLLEVYRKLKNDRDSRQAVLSLWRPDLDNVPGKKDYPCTISLTFSLRGDALNLSVMMRSNDVWLGTAYDVFQFTQCQQTLARLLDVPAGDYHHHAVSFHLYERDLEKVEQLHAPPHLRVAPEGPTGFDLTVYEESELLGYDGHGYLKRHAASVLWPGDEVEERLSNSELWYRRQLS